MGSLPLSKPPEQSLTPALSVRDVSFDYPGGVPALRGVSLQVEQGEKVAILGANGCGKSTLLMVLGGLQHPTAGRVEAFGEGIDAAALGRPETAWRFRRRVGFVFQNADAQLFSPTVREEIAFGPLQMGLDQDEVERRVADVASMLEIGKLMGRAPFRLSGGEKKKVALASILVTNPQVILLDEPSSGLDPRSQRWLVEALVALHASGKTLVTATHDLDVVAELADRAIVMNEDHGIEAEGHVCDILAAADLLLRVNLIHEHSHWHDNIHHTHPHHHDLTHEHPHE